MKMKKGNLIILIAGIVILLGLIAAGFLLTRSGLFQIKALATPTLGIGSKMVSKIDGMTLMFVPSGEFGMGYRDYDSADQKYDYQFRQHFVTLDSYWIDATEVTNAMFSKFVQETNHVTDAEKNGNGHVALPQIYWQRVDGATWRNPLGPDSNINGLGKHPVVQVSWNDASAFCQWAGRRLPTEAEWEKAARGTDMRLYPWGDSEPTGKLANFPDMNFAKYIQLDFMKTDVDDGYTFTAPVGSYPKGASPYGVLDMAGNVWEWVNDFSGGEELNDLPSENPTGPASGEVHVIRGASWDINYGEAAVNRQMDWPGESSASLGFRCALSSDQ
jgi:formylglycine-generating enzyme required for sulfatase activity